MKTSQAGPRKGKPAVKALTDKQFDALVRETRQTFDGLWRIVESAASQLDRQLAFLAALYGEDALKEAVAKARGHIRRLADHDTDLRPTVVKRQFVCKR